MSEEEFWEYEEFEYDDSSEEQFGDRFLAEENASGNINMVFIPDLNYDVAEMLESYLKILSKCKTNNAAMDVLIELHNKVSTITILRYQYDELQEKAELLNESMEHLSLR